MGRSNIITASQLNRPVQFSSKFMLMRNKKLSCRREAAQCFLSLKILQVTQDRSRSFEITLCVSSY